MAKHILYYLSFVRVESSMIYEKILIFFKFEINLERELIDDILQKYRTINSTANEIITRTKATDYERDVIVTMLHESTNPTFKKDLENIKLHKERLERLTEAEDNYKMLLNMYHHRG